MINPKEQLKHTMTAEWQSVIAKYAKMSSYKKALDIGTAAGLSAWTIAQNGEGQITSLDIKGQSGARTLAEHYGYSERTAFIEGTSDEFFEINVQMFDLIIIDGSHKQSEVTRDAMSSWKVLNSGGYLVFDDYNHPRLRSDIQPAVANLVKETGAEVWEEKDKAIIQKKYE